MAENLNTGGPAPAARYVILTSLFEIMLEFLFLVCALDLIRSSIMLVGMISLIYVIVIMIYLLFIWVKSRCNFIIYSTIQKPGNLLREVLLRI